MLGKAKPKIIPQSSFLQEVEREGKERISLCYQCQKCSNGCPVVFAMDFPPHRLIRMVQLGQKEEVLKSSTIWLCASCETCTTRCPNEIDIAKLMDTLRQMSLRLGLKGKEEDIPAFHAAFLSSLKNWGRVHELEMIGRYKWKSGNLLKDFKLGLEMFKRGRLKLFPTRIKGKKEIRLIFAQAKGEGKR